MRYALNKAVPTTADNLRSLLSITGPDSRAAKDVILQAPDANAAVVNFGNNSQQPGFIKPGGSVVLEGCSLENTYVVGTGGDFIIILVVA